MRISRNLIIMLGALAIGALWFEPAWADKLSDAINAMPQGTGAGQIDPNAPAGFLGIPGAPHVSPVLSFLWAIWVGWIFSTVGAFGGVMAGVGHMTVFGLGGYAKSLGKNTPLNKIVTDSIKASNQWLVGTSGLISSFNYYRMGRLVLPLAVAPRRRLHHRCMGFGLLHRRQGVVLVLPGLLRPLRARARPLPLLGDLPCRSGPQEEGQGSRQGL